jgi:hypothetical protein
MGTVGVRAGIRNLGRERFTIAHEIGHYVLGCNDTASSTCTWQDIGISIREKPEREIAANRFAAELLLPSDRVRHLIRQQSLSIETARSIAHKFRTSLTATALQCASVAQQACAVVVSINGIIRYYRPSKSWTYFITVDRPFGKGSVAARLDLVDNEATGVVNILGWAPSGRMDQGADVLENSIYLSPHNMTLTILTELALKRSRG